MADAEVQPLEPPRGVRVRVTDRPTLDILSGTATIGPTWAIRRAFYVIPARNRRWGRGRSRAAAKRRRRRLGGLRPCMECGDRLHNGSCRDPFPRWV